MNMNSSKHISGFMSYVGIAIFFLISIFLGMYWYDEAAYITTITQFHDYSVLEDTSKTRLLRGEYIRGEFMATHHNLGTLRFRFRTFGRLNEDTLQFRLREKGTESWIVTNEYNTSVFINGGMYPFGFPVISNSKGRVYEFEVFSTKGTNANSVSLMSEYRPIASQYIYTRESLMNDKVILRQFVKEKLSSLMHDSAFLFYIGMFVIPSIYLLLVRQKFSLELIFLFGIASSIYLHMIFFYLPVAINSNCLLFILCCDIYICMSSFYPYLSSRMNSLLQWNIDIFQILMRYSFFLAAFFALLIPINLYMNLEIAASRAAIGSMYLLIVGVSISWYLLFFQKRRPNKKTVQKV